MAKDKHDTQSLEARLVSSNEPAVVIRMSEYREACGGDLGEMKKYVAGQYRDDYLMADEHAGRKRLVRVDREGVLKLIVPSPAKSTDKEKSKEAEKPATPAAPVPVKDHKPATDKPVTPAVPDKK